MKLNKKGWALSTEVFYLIIFVICLIVAIIGIIRLGLYLNNGEKYFDYQSLEVKLEESSKNYVSNKVEVDDYELVRSSTLKSNNYLSDFEDGKGNSCSGYVEVYNNNEYKSYVKCPYYETFGYDSGKDF